MRSRPQPTSRPFPFGGRQSPHCVLIALVLTSSGIAAPPEKNKANPPEPLNAPRQPLFQPFNVQPENVAVLALGASSSPRNGPWSTLSALMAGTHPDVQVWNLRGPLSTRPGRVQLGASSLFLAGFGPHATMPLVQLATLRAGDEMNCWNLVNTDEVRPIPKMLFGQVQDKRGIFNGDLEIDAFTQIIVMAHFTSAEAFKKAARQDVTYTHLFTDTARYRGEVIHTQGRLIRLSRFDPPDEARGAGVSNLYEGWVMTDAYGENPICVVFTVLPPGLKVDSERRFNLEVGFDGYFYKRYRYKAYDSKKANQFRDAPLLIGHTLTGQFGSNAENAAPETWGHNVIWIFLSLAGGAVILVAGMTYWFRRNDRQIRRRISDSRDREFVPPGQGLEDLPAV
jgi:hypothetical protein